MFYRPKNAFLSYPEPLSMHRISKEEFSGEKVFSSFSKMNILAC